MESKVNPDTANGHIDIANELAEQLAKIRISGEEWQVFWVIARKTWGFHKSWDRISLRQFYAATGIKKPNIIRALKKLQEKNIIKKDNGNPHSWHINSHYDTWKPLSKKIIEPLSKKITKTRGQATINKKGKNIINTDNEKNIIKKDNGVIKKDNFQSSKSRTEANPPVSYTHLTLPTN